MARLMRLVPAMASAGWILLAKWTGFNSAQAQLAALLLTGAGLFSIRRMAAKNEASPIHKAMVLFTAAAIRRRLDRTGLRLAWAQPGRDLVCGAVPCGGSLAPSWPGGVHYLLRPQNHTPGCVEYGHFPSSKGDINHGTPLHHHCR